MKKIILLFVLFSSACSYSQTTLDEYNYLTKGYKIALESGLDLKQGYKMFDIYEHDDALYSFYFSRFVDVSTQKTKAISVVAISKLWGNKYFLCIPLNNSELTNRYNDFLTSWDRDILKAYSITFSEIMVKSIK
jgi:hypothetical protein